MYNSVFNLESGRSIPRYQVVIKSDLKNRRFSVRANDATVNRLVVRNLQSLSLYKVGQKSKPT